MTYLIQVQYNILIYIGSHILRFSEMTFKAVFCLYTWTAISPHVHYRNRELKMPINHKSNGETALLVHHGIVRRWRCGSLVRQCPLSLLLSITYQFFFGGIEGEGRFL